MRIRPATEAHRDLRNRAQVRGRAPGLAQRGKGVARTLLTELIRLAPQRGVHVLLARIVEGNPASLAVHEKLGFTPIGVMRRVGEKFGRVLGVRLLERQLDPA